MYDVAQMLVRFARDRLFLYNFVHSMPEKTERSNCRFSVQRTPDGKPLLVVQLFQDSIQTLKNSTLGFDLLGGLRPEAAQKLADMLNEHVLDTFVTVKTPDTPAK